MWNHGSANRGHWCLSLLGRGSALPRLGAQLELRRSGSSLGPSHNYIVPLGLIPQAFLRQDFCELPADPPPFFLSSICKSRLWVAAWAAGDEFMHRVLICMPDWASLELSPSVESCGCGLGNPAPLGLLGQAPFVLTLLHGAPGITPTASPRAEWSRLPHDHQHRVGGDWPACSC